MIPTLRLSRQTKYSNIHDYSTVYARDKVDKFHGLVMVKILNFTVCHRLMGK